MEKFTTSLKDLVSEVMTNSNEIKQKAKKDDPTSCLLMGMDFLLGISNSIDLKKASQYLQNKSLADDPDANRLLGLIAELEGNCGAAFKYYSKAAGDSGENIDSYLQTCFRHFFVLKLELFDIQSFKI